jgi:hypothetical protein
LLLAGLGRRRVHDCQGLGGGVPLNVRIGLEPPVTTARLRGHSRTLAQSTVLTPGGRKAWVSIASSDCAAGVLGWLP